MNILIAGFVAILGHILTVYLILLFAISIMRMVRADESNSIVKSIAVLTDPPCKYLKRKFPRLLLRTDNGVMDLSLAVLMLGTACIKIMLEHVHTWLMQMG